MHPAGDLQSEFALEGDEARRARDAAREGRYQLLLGAGASAGAVGERGELPMAKKLVELLAEKFPEAPIPSGTQLPRAYQRALLTSSEEDLWRFFASIFARANHQTWFRSFATLPWSRIWTLNVDDTVERALQSAGDLSRRFNAISWDDPYLESGDLQIIHLHGHVIGSDPRKLVFSFSEYQKAAASQPVWHKILEGLLSTQPFVIVGAGLLNDPDVEQILMTKKPQSVAPSIVVDPYIDEANAWELRNLGYRVARLTGEEFAAWWQEATGLDHGTILDLRDQAGLALPQFTRLSAERVPPLPGGHDFLGGDQPQWRDIIENREALFSWVNDEVRALAGWLASDREPTLRIVYGGRFSGLSTGLMSIAKRAVTQHFRAYSFDRSSTWEPGLLVDLAASGPTLVVVEAAADFGDVIDRTMRVAVKRNAPLVILAADGPRNDLRLEGRLAGPYRKESRQVRPKLSRPDARALLEALGGAGRLGRLEQLGPTERVDAVVGQDVFSAMIGIEHGPGFQKRLMGEVRELPRGWAPDLLLLLGFAAKSNRPVNLSDAALALGVSANALSTVIDDSHVSALVERADDTLFARQRDRALDVLIKRFGSEWALESLGSMLSNLAPANTRVALRERNRIPLLVGGLMTFNTLDAHFSLRDLDTFYESLRPVFGSWNGRYWEQRAKHAKAAKVWPKAESFAGRAVTLYDDQFTRTTYGTILVNRAEEAISSGDSQWTDYYARGMDQFEKAQSAEQGSRVSFFAYLTATITLLEKAVSSGNAEEHAVALAAVKSDWNGVFVQLRISLQNETELSSVRRAQQLLERWERLPPTFDS